MKEFKRLDFVNIKSESSGRVRVGIAAVHGNIDAGRDRSHLGCFAKSLQERVQWNRVRHLWNHNSGQPPIASIVDLKEVGKEDLPTEVLTKYPDATGGLKVSREYYPKEINPMSEIILYGIDKGDINEMSYAYDVIRADYTEQEIGGEKVQIRELRELRLYDTSDVNYGMNPATAANIKGYLEILPLGTIYQQLLLHNEELKSGRRNSSSDETLINQIHSLAVDLGALCAPAADEDEKNSKETETKEAEAGNNSTSLNREWLDLQQRKRQFLDFYRS